MGPCLHLGRRFGAGLIAFLGLSTAVTCLARNPVPVANDMAASEADGRARPEARESSDERRRLQMARMRKQLHDLRESQDEIRSAAIARRLATLDELRIKELITAEEYASKRQDIVEGYKGN